MSLWNPPLVEKKLGGFWNPARDGSLFVTHPQHRESYGATGRQMIVASDLAVHFLFSDEKVAFPVIGHDMGQ